MRDSLVVTAVLALLAREAHAQQGAPAPQAPPPPIPVQEAAQAVKETLTRPAPKIVDWYMDGKIDIDSMITHVLPLDRINEGFDLMRAGKSIRTVITYD